MVVLLYACLLGLTYLAMSWHLILLRRRAKRQQDDRPLRYYDRCSHGVEHLAEYAPFGLLLLALVEHAGLAGWALHLLGLAFTAGNLLHLYAYARFPGDNRASMLGMAMISAVYGLTCVIGLAQFAAM